MTSLRHKLWFGIGALLLILLSVSILSGVVLTSYSHTLQQVFHDNYNSAVYCDRMLNSLDRLNLWSQSPLWTQADSAAIDEPVEVGTFQTNLAAQQNNCTLEGEADHTQLLADYWARYKDLLDQIKTAAAGDRPILYRNSLLPLYDQMQKNAQWIADANMSNMVSVDGQVKQTLLGVRTALVVLAIAGTLAAVVVVGAVGRSIMHPLESLTRSARQIEGGQLDLSLTVGTRDEIGQLAEAFNSMAAKLREFRRIDHERLLRTQQTTQLAIDSLPDAVFILGPGGDVENSNRAAKDILGIEPGMKFEQLDKLRWLAPLYESAKSGQQPEPPLGYASAIQVFHQGHERFLLPRAVPMMGSDKKPIGVSLTLVDVTGLRMADEAKSNVVSIVSHELRTPLTSVRMALGLLSTGKFALATSEQSQLLTAAKEDAERLHRIIENLMNISRLESGRVAFDLHPMAPHEIISQAVDPLRAAFADKNISVQVDGELDLPDVLADSASIGSALTNLLSNALKFTPGGGKVVVSAAAEGEFVAFMVTDTGPGIPEQYSSRIFDKFFRVPQKDAPAGAGLGLTIAKDVIEAHGGTIKLCRPSGPGSRFQFTLRKAGVLSQPAALNTSPRQA